MDDRQRFGALLDERPDHWGLRFLLADWLAERGDILEYTTQRWQIRHQKCPEPGRPMYPANFWEGWHWWGAGVDAEDLPGQRALLPAPLHEPLPSWDHATREAAENALARALVARGWSPD